MKNDYEIRGDVTAIIINSPKYGRLETFISTCKLELAKEFPNSWGVSLDEGTKALYVKGNLPRKNGKRGTIGIHRWITNARPTMEVDHIDHDTLNNTDSNLRELTCSENQQNRKGDQANSKSGIRGVYWSKSKSKWYVATYINKKLKQIGVFDSIIDAERVAIESRKKHMPFSQEYSGK